MNVLKGLLEVGGGVAVGLILGLFLCCFPSNDQVRAYCRPVLNGNRPESRCSVGWQEDLALRRTLLLLALSIFAVFFSSVIGVAGAGGLCTLVLAFVAALGWSAEKVTDPSADVSSHARSSCGQSMLLLRPLWQPWWDAAGMCSSPSSLA